MGNKQLQLFSIISMLVFTTCFFLLTFLIFAVIDMFVYRVITVLIALILYMNVVKLFVFEYFSLDPHGNGKSFSKFVLYFIGFIILALSLMVGGPELYGVPVLYLALFTALALGAIGYVIPKAFIALFRKLDQTARRVVKEGYLDLDWFYFSRILTYFMMYVVTIGIFVLPFFMRPEQAYDFPVLRIIIIAFASILLTKYFVYMLIGPLHDIVYRLKHKFRYEEQAYTPLVTVMIPAWNEEVGVLHTIDSILKSTYRHIEIIVINDGSTDGSDRIIQDYMAKKRGKYDGVDLRYRYQENKGKGGALNHAIKIARGDILLSIDADCIVAPNAIEAFVETFKDKSVMATVGNVRVANSQLFIGVVQHLEFLFSFYFKRTESLLGSIYIIGGAAGAFRKEVFEQVGGYDLMNITEDIELTMRIQEAGMKIDFTPDAMVYTEGASDMKSLKKQRLRWKRGRFQTFHKHIYMFFSRRKRHNKILTWIMMPLAMFQEVQLLLEIPFVSFLYVFSVLNSDFTSFISGVVVVGTMFVVQLMFYEKETRKLSFALLAPIGWLLFYVATYVEVSALVRSIQAFVMKKEVLWQRWERRGIGKSPVLPEASA